MIFLLEKSQCQQDNTCTHVIENPIPGILEYYIQEIA